LHAAIPLYLQCDYSCSSYPGSMCETGCGECSISSIINYWYRYDSNVRLRWNQEIGNAAPNPCNVVAYERQMDAFEGYSVNWNGDRLRSALRNIGLELKVISGDIDDFQSQYLSKGIPVVLRCDSSSGLTYTQHFIVATKVVGDRVYIKSSNSGHGSYMAKWQANTCINSNIEGTLNHSFAVAPPLYFR